jgi:protein involved in polysaccharide export with SLBB domain
MRGRMGKLENYRGGLWLFALLPFALTGCSSVGSPFGSLTPRNPMIPTAQVLREAARGPLPLPRELDKGVLTTYIVEPGDVLLVQPADLDSPIRLPGDQTVLPDGTIHLGRYGRVLVAGKDVDEIQSLVRAVVMPHVQNKDPGPITVRLITRASKMYYVLGEVNSPGAFQYAGRETVLDAILAAGGLTDRASRVNIILSRPSPPDGCRVVLPICYQQIVQLGDTTTNYQLAPGDRIFVSSKTLCEQVFGSPRRDPCNCGWHIPCAIPGGCGEGPGRSSALGMPVPLRPVTPPIVPVRQAVPVAQEQQPAEQQLPPMSRQPASTQQQLPMQELPPVTQQQSMPEQQLPAPELQLPATTPGGAGAQSAEQQAERPGGN